MNECNMRFYLNVQNEWMRELKATGINDNKYWECMSAIDKCFPSIRMQLDQYINPSLPLEIHLWLR